MNIRPLESLTREELIELIRHEREAVGTGGVAPMDESYEELRAALETIAPTIPWYDAGCCTVHDVNHNEVAHPFECSIADALPHIVNAASELLEERDDWRRQAQYETEVAQAAIERVEEMEAGRDRLRATLNQQEQR